MAAFDFSRAQAATSMAEGQQASVPIQSLLMQIDADAVCLVRTQFQQLMGAPGGSTIGTCLNFLDDDDKLIESLPPTVVKTHFLVFLAALFFPMDGECSVLRPISMRFKRNDRREENHPALGHLD